MAEAGYEGGAGWPGRRREALLAGFLFGFEASERTPRWGLPGCEVGVSANRDASSGYCHGKGERPHGLRVTPTPEEQLAQK